MNEPTTNVESLDIETLEFCRHLAWQSEFALGVGRSNSEKRAQQHAYANMQNLITSYIQRATEIEKGKSND